MPQVVFIDPQSYNNLSLYDKGVLSTFNKDEVTFIGSNNWNCDPLTNIDAKLWFSYNNKANPITKAVSYVKTLYRISRFIKKTRPSVVHIQWLRLLVFDRLFLKWMKRHNIKVILTAHNILPHDSGNKYKVPYAKYYEDVDIIIVHSEKTQKELANMFKLPVEKIRVIPHGIIDIDVLEQDTKKRISELRRELKIENKIVLSSLGLQSKYKGVDLIVDVWNNNDFLKNNSNFHLLIAGVNSGIDMTPLRGLNNVTIVDDRISNIDFLSYIKLSDVILLPYRNISQSGVLFSAINNNIPVVVSDAGGLSEPLQYGKIGWNIGNANYENLEQSLLSLVNNPAELMEIKNNNEAFNKVKNVYSWERISNMTKQLYASI